MTSHHLSITKSTMTTMLVPANRVVTLCVDAFTADWTRYTVQADIDDMRPVVSSEYLESTLCRLTYRTDIYSIHS